MISGSLCSRAFFIALAFTLTSTIHLSGLRADENDDFAARAMAALKKKSHFDFRDTQLQDVCEVIANQLGLPVLIDERALDEVGISNDTPISKNISGISLQSALRLTLKDLELTYVFRDGAVLITTPESAESRLHTKFYEVEKLARCRPGSYDPVTVDLPYDFDSVIDLITTIYPETWDDYGGPASVDVLGTKLVISQTNEVHTQIAGLLKGLNLALEASNSVSPGNPPRVASYLAEDPTAINRIEAGLNSSFNFQFDNAELVDVVNMLQSKFPFNIELDVKAMDDVGIGSDTPITFNVRDMSLRHGLRHMLDKIELNYYIDNESLIISTPEEIEYSNRRVRIYPVGDLVFTVDATSPNYHAMISVITYTIAPESWEEVGGAGTIDEHVGTRSLVVSATDDVHEQVERLLEKLRGRKVAKQARNNKRAVSLKLVGESGNAKRKNSKTSDDDPFANDPFGDDPFRGGDSSEDPFAPTNSSNSSAILRSTPDGTYNNSLQPQHRTTVRTTRLGTLPGSIWVPSQRSQSDGVAIEEVATTQKDTPASSRRRRGGKKSSSSKSKNDAKTKATKSDRPTDHNEGYTRRIYFVSPSSFRGGQSFGGGLGSAGVVGQRTPNIQFSPENGVTLNQFGGGGFGGSAPSGGGGFGIQQVYQDPTIKTKELSKIIRELVAKESWDSEDTSIIHLPGRLIIRQSVENHRAIIDFLKDLSVYRGISLHSSAKSPHAQGFGTGGGIQGGGFGSQQGGFGGQQGGFFAVPDDQAK